MCPNGVRRGAPSATSAQVEVLFEVKVEKLQQIYHFFISPERKNTVNKTQFCVNHPGPELVDLDMFMLKGSDALTDERELLTLQEEELYNT